MNKMNLKSGIIEINGEIVSPGYTFEDFQKSAFLMNLHVV